MVQHTKFVNYGGHFVHLCRADIGTIGESEVKQCPLSQQISLRKRLAVVGGKGEGTSNVSASY
jgi:hypothetical protein